MLTRLLPAFASLPLLLSACGGSGTSPTGTGATGGGSLPASSLSVTFSELPAYGTASLSADLFLRGFAPQPAGTVMARGMDGKSRVFVFPTLFDRDPQLPGLEWVESGLDQFRLQRTLLDVSMGSARDWKLMDTAHPARKRFVVVDHGSEYTTGYANWPFGLIWVATDSGNGFQFEAITRDRAFNHSVAVGDLRGTGRDDIVSINMGTRSGIGQYNSLHLFEQNPDGSFVQNATALQLNVPGNSGAVAVADLDGDGQPEVIQSAYLSQQTDFPAGEWGAWRVWKRGSSGSYNVASTTAREGLYTRMGGTQIAPVDLDGDGDLDLVIFLEGATPDATTRYNANGVEIYLNEGGLRFTRATARFLPVNEWRFSELQARELAVADLNADGFPDLVLNGWSGSAYQPGPTQVNIGALVFLNQGGKTLVHQRQEPAFTLQLDRSDQQPLFLRLMDSAGGVTRLFGIARNGAPMVIRHRQSSRP